MRHLLIDTWKNKITNLTEYPWLGIELDLLQVAWTPMFVDIYDSQYRQFWRKASEYFKIIWNKPKYTYTNMQQK